MAVRPEVLRRVLEAHDIVGNALLAALRERDEWAELAKKWQLLNETLEGREAVLRGTIKAQDERERLAGIKCGVDAVVAGCDWPDAVADKALELKHKLALAEHDLILKDCTVCHGSGEFVDSCAGGMIARCHCWANRIAEVRKTEKAERDALQARVKTVNDALKRGDVRIVGRNADKVRAVRAALAPHVEGQGGQG